jgi:branched-chain amino acid transport system permease protein
VNMQWGYAGLFSTGIMGSVALGGLAVVLISAKPVPEGWAAGGPALLFSLALGAATIALAGVIYRKMAKGRARNLSVAAVLLVGFIVFRMIFDPSSVAVEAFNPATAGNLGGLGRWLLGRWVVCLLPQPPGLLARQPLGCVPTIWRLRHWGLPRSFWQ